MRKFCLALVTTLLCTSPAMSQDGRKYMMVGHGSKTCGGWTADRREDGLAATADRAWVLGFVTAFNLYGGKPDGNVSASVDVPGMMAWMDNYCTAHPLTSISEGASSLVSELNRRPH